MNYCFILYALLTTSIIHSLDTIEIKSNFAKASSDMQDIAYVTSDHDEYCEIVIYLYFKNAKVVLPEEIKSDLEPFIIPHLKPKIKYIIESPLPENKHIIRILRNLSSQRKSNKAINFSDRRLYSFIQEIVGKSIQEAFNIKQQETTICSTKMKVAIITLCGTIIGAVVSLTIYFTHT